MRATWETPWTYERVVTAGKMTGSEKRVENVRCGARDRNF